MPQTILIVDDDPVGQRIISYTLSRHGYTTVIADNGRHALERLAETAIDLAIVDLSMPVMDGIAFVQAVRDETRWQTLPIIMLTASGQDQDRSLARSAGANGFLTKPAGSRDVVATVQDWLS